MAGSRRPAGLGVQRHEGAQVLPGEITWPEVGGVHFGEGAAEVNDRLADMVLATGGAMEREGLRAIGEGGGGENGVVVDRGHRARQGVHLPVENAAQHLRVGGGPGGGRLGRQGFLTVSLAPFCCWIMAQGYLALDGESHLARGFRIELGGVANHDGLQRAAPAVGIETARPGDDRPGGASRPDDQSQAGAAEIDDGVAPTAVAGEANFPGNDSGLQQGAAGQAA